MSVVWIVTTGNSDVKLTDDTGWGALRIKKMEQLYPCENEFAPTEESNSDLFALPARVLGIVYGDAIGTYWDRLTFPLLDGFCQEFKNDKRNKPDRIIVLLTDQEAIFDDYSRGHSDSPYWQDTYTLQPILKHYFTQIFGEKFANEKIEFSVLKQQQGAEGLDDWDATLMLVRLELARWEENKWISKNDRVIVSHQAGTPAISSAVQLTCLIRFGKKVEFLVSSELAPNKPKFLKGSSYFETLQFKKLEDLLARDDYAGVASVVDSLGLEDSVLKVKLDHLLEVAKLWNAAKFDEFANRMGLVTPSRVREWWWKGYEMAYLAVVRMKNGDPTEALFHSVRAIEGLICEWAIHKERRSDLYGQSLYDLFKLRNPESNNLPIKVVWSKLAFVRNKLFHTLRGISAEEVWDAWDESSKNGWENRMFACINFVTKDDRSQEFKSLKDASLMSQVHKDLEEVINAITSY
jgi:hypothetical protein